MLINTYRSSKVCLQLLSLPEEGVLIGKLLWKHAHADFVAVSFVNRCSHTDIRNICEGFSGREHASEQQSSTFDLTSLWVAGSPDEEQEHAADDEQRADCNGC